MSAAGERGGFDMHARQNGIVINEILSMHSQRAILAAVPCADTPNIAEAEGVHRAIAIADMAEAPVYIVSSSCAGCVESSSSGRDRGIPAFAETVRSIFFFPWITMTNRDLMERST